MIVDLTEENIENVSCKGSILVSKSEVNLQTLMKRKADIMSESNLISNSHASNQKFITKKPRNYSNQIIDLCSPIIQQQSISALCNPSEWEVTLYIDSRYKDNALIHSNLVSLNINCSLKTLSVGDFLWVATKKENTEKSSDNDKLNEEFKLRGGAVLDCIIERRSIVDFSKNLINESFTTKISRLKATKVKKCIYIVEGDAVKMTANYIKEAMGTAYIEEKVHILKSRNIDHTTNFLKNLHCQISRNFYTGKIKHEEMQSFTEFNTSIGKTHGVTTKDVFSLQLKQIPGCSSSITAALVNKYGSLGNFYLNFKNKDQEEIMGVIANLQRGGGKKTKIGPSVAKILYNVFFTQ